MNNKPILILSVLIALAGFGIYFWSATPAEMGIVGEQEEVMEKADVVESELMTKKGSYESYSSEKLALAEDGKVVLFFRASWCPTCRTLDANIRTNLDKIPEGVTILDVDYDSSTALKQKYGVTVQHTLIQVDASGKELAKWQGSSNLSDLIARLK